MSCQQWRAVYHAVSIVNPDRWLCTLFAHADGRHRTVVVRNAAAVAANWLASAAKGLKTESFVEMASFLLSQ
jgi:hypothetical protein